MKKVALLLLAGFLAVGLAGCGGSGGDDYDPVGTWNFTVAWDGYLPSSGLWHLYDNRTFVTGQLNGTWLVDKDSIALSFLNGTTYIGTMHDSKTMTGTMAGTVVGGSKGVWSAAKVSDTP